MDETQGLPARPRHRARTHVLVAVLTLVALVASLVGTVVALLPLLAACTPDYSEATIVAPDSARGTLLCTVTDSGELASSAVVLIVALIGCTVVVAGGAAAWVRLGSLWLVLALLMVAVVLPWAVRGAVTNLSPDCTAAQWDEHGAAGCERSEEQRPGFGQYSASTPASVSRTPWCCRTGPWRATTPSWSARPAGSSPRSADPSLCQPRRRADATCTRACTKAWSVA